MRPPVSRVPTPTTPVPKPVTRVQAPVPKVQVQSDASELVNRLGRARAKCEEFLKEKSRLSGELDAANRRHDELEAKCKADFDCESVELPSLVEQMKTEAESKAVEAEVVLGLREVAPTE